MRINQYFFRNWNQIREALNEAHQPLDSAARIKENDNPAHNDLLSVLGQLTFAIDQVDVEIGRLISRSARRAARVRTSGPNPAPGDRRYPDYQTMVHALKSYSLDVIDPRNAIFHNKVWLEITYQRLHRAGLAHLKAMIAVELDKMGPAPPDDDDQV